MAGSGSENWSAVENEASHDVIVLISTDSKARTGMVDFGEKGPHLNASGSVWLEPKETRELLTWLVVCESMEEVETYASLSLCDRLP
jgi:hypothetical protein